MPVTPSVPSPIEDLATTLSQMPALFGYAKVLAGKNQLAATRAPPSVVIYPVKAGYQAASDNVASMVDIDILIEARIWGASLAQAWELRQRLVQALKEQATGREDDAASLEAAGLYIVFVSEEWDTTPDTSAQGQELAVQFTARLSAAPTVSFGTGEVVTTSINPAT
jgi:hypothetical protein